MSKKNKTTEFINKKATYEYFLTDRFEAGIQLQGTEIKSIRAGHVSLTDAYCAFDDPTNLVVRSLYIKEYEFGTYANHEPRRARKLLLKKQELKKLLKRVKEKGNTIVPIRLFINERGFAKLEIALATGKKSHNKKDSIREKDQKRDMERIQKGGY
jgi:SsrA-binding protein